MTGTKNGKSIWVKIMTGAAILLLCILAAFATVPRSDTVSKAALPDKYTNLSSGSGLGFDLSTMDYRPSDYDNYYSENKLTFSSATNGVGTSHGDFHITGDKGVEVLGDGLTLSISNSSTNISETKNMSWESNIAISNSGNIADAIRDGLLTVRFIPYIKTAAPTTKDGDDLADFTLTYNNGLETESSTAQVYFYSEERTKEWAPLTVTKGIESGAYLSLKFSNFQFMSAAAGGVFSIKIVEIGVRVVVGINTGMNFKSPVVANDVEIYDSMGTRDASADPTQSNPRIYVKPTDEVKITAEIYMGATSITFGGASPNGVFYRKLFLQNSSASTTILKWEYNAACLSLQSTFNGVPVTVGNSGAVSVFYTRDGNTATTSVKVTFCRDDGVAFSDIKTISFQVDIDAGAAQIPELNESSGFYKQHIVDKEYFTKTAGYNYGEDADGSRVVTSVTIGSSKDGTDLRVADKSLDMYGTSTQNIYYRIKKLSKDATPSYIKFSKQEATGILCSTNENGTTYFGIQISLENPENPGYYLTQGIYSLELANYDVVGNITYATVPVVVRVDIEDYAFTSEVRLGSSGQSGEDSIVPSMYYRLTYATRNGTTTTAFSENAVFKRGDNVIVKLTYYENGAKKYILTYFQTPAGDKYTTATYQPNGSGEIIINPSQSTGEATLKIGNLYTDSANRIFKFTMKELAEINIMGYSQTYNGETKYVTAQALSGSTQINNITINLTYSTTLNGDYVAANANFPKEAGTYYYRCEVNNNRYYGYKEGQLEIAKADPTLSNLRVNSIIYGDSLAKVDFDRTNYIASDAISCLYLVSGADHGRYFSNLSSNGVYGYFVITSPSYTVDSYKNPLAGTLSLNVQFIPAVVDEFGKFVRNTDGSIKQNTNYNTLTTTASVVVAHSDKVTINADNLETDGKIYVEYNGAELPVTGTAAAEIGGENLTDYLVYTYSTSGLEGSFQAKPPTDAGTYYVRIAVNPIRCNYDKTLTLQYVVEKRKLTVTATPSVTEYQRETHPAVYATHYGTVTTNYGNLKYIYTYYYFIDGKNNDEMAVAENLVPESALFQNTIPEIAGKYLVRIEINENNFENDDVVYSTLTINKATLANPYLNWKFPAVSFASVSMDAHLYYMQPLSEAKFAIDTNTIIRYLFHDGDFNKYALREVAGAFVLSHELYTGDGSDASLDSFVANAKSCDTLSAGRYTMYKYFIPSGAYRKNFQPLYEASDIIIGKAQAVFDDVSVTSVVYGHLIHNIEDIEVSKSIKVRISGSGGSATYEPIDPIKYSYSLYSVSSALLAVGAHVINIQFMPIDTANFASTVSSCQITVEKADLTVEFSGEALSEGAFRYAYKGYVAPSLTFLGRIAGDENVVINGVYSFTKGGQNYVDSVLTAGTYIGTFTINNANYQGSDSFTVEISKATLRAMSTPTVEEADSAVSYQRLMKDVTFTGGRMVSVINGETVAGRYKLDYADDVRFDTIGLMQYKLCFIPNDDNYEIYTGEGGNEYLFTVTVTKQDISAGITLTVNSFPYTKISAATEDSELFSHETSVLTNGTAYSTNIGDLLNGYRYLTVKLSVAMKPTSGYYNAGSYAVTVTIDDPCYRGSMSGTLVVTKILALFEIESTELLFTNRPQNLAVSVYEAKLNNDGTDYVKGDRISETVIQEFYQKGTRLPAYPSAIGKYTAVLSLLSNNYDYYDGTSLQVDMTIAINTSLITIGNITQEYTKLKALNVSLGINQAQYTMFYTDVLTGTVYNTMPQNAGTYSIHLQFTAEDNGGYGITFVYGANLIIHPYTANIIVSDTLTVAYTGKKVSLSYHTDPYGLNVIVTYMAEGESEYTPAEVFHANVGNGYHSIKLTVNHQNYQGEAIIRYRIEPAALTILQDPTFLSYTYNSSLPPVLANDGVVRFDYETYVSGVFAVALSEVNLKNVGTHRVTYSFTAMNGGTVDTNYKVAYGTTEVVIVKQALPASVFVIGEGQQQNILYDGQSHPVTASVLSGTVYAPSGANNDFYLLVYYKTTSETTNAPRELGEYTVRVEVVSKNYSGTATWEKKLTITHGKPEIRKNPSVRNMIFNIGDTFTDDHINSNGEAFIAGTNTVIGGTFSVTPTYLGHANINTVTVKFIPSDIAHFTTVEFEIKVNVTGKDPLSGVTGYGDWTNKTVGTHIDIGTYSATIVTVPSREGITYGAKVSEFNLYFEGTGAAFLNGFGRLQFVNPDAVLNVGEPALVAFTPYGDNANIYNIMYGYVTLEIGKGVIDVTSSRLIGFDGESFSTVMFYLNDTLVDSTAQGIVLRFFRDVERADEIQAGEVLSFINAGTTVYYTYESNNYAAVRRSVALEVYTRILSDDIVANNEKSYDGRAITISDLAPSVLNIASLVAGYTILVLDGQGNAVSGTEIGTYTVLLSVVDPVYFGTKTIAFTVTKRDISKWTPEIRTTPTLKTGLTFRVGDKLTVEHLNQDGKAYIINAATEIAGVFTIASVTFTAAGLTVVYGEFIPNDSTLYSTAEFYIEVEVFGDASLRGVDNHGVWDDVEITTELGNVKIIATPKTGLPHGSRLSDFNLTFENVGSGNGASVLLSLGLLQFVNPDAIIDVGERALISYTRTDSLAYLYHVMYGYITVVLNKAEVQNPSYRLIGTEGTTMDKSVFYLYSDAILLDSKGSLQVYTDAARTILFDPTRVLELSDIGTLLYFNYTTKNYTVQGDPLVIKGEVALEVYGNQGYRLFGFFGLTLADAVFYAVENGTLEALNGTLFLFTDPGMSLLFPTEQALTAVNRNTLLYFSYYDGINDIILGWVCLEIYDDISLEMSIQPSKVFDGKKISDADLMFTVILNGVQIDIDRADIEIIISDQYGYASEGIYMGNYIVTITVWNYAYCGKASFLFTILPKDSYDLNLDHYESTYLSVTAPVLRFGTQTISAAEYKLYYKLQGASDLYYTMTLPAEAGIYSVRAVVENNLFTGVREFTFTIAPLRVRMIAGAVYQKPYGENVAPDIRFTAIDDVGVAYALSYMVYYYSASYTYTNIMPSAAGDYTARIVLDDSNYAIGILGYGEIIYRIQKAEVSFIDDPVLQSLVDAGGDAYHIRYGQPLSDIRVIGGSAGRDGKAIAGSFQFSGASSILSVGTKIVKLIFIPTDKNYSTAEKEFTITIAKAEAYVILDNLYANYDGTSKRAELTYTVQPAGVEVQIRFKNSLDEEVNPINAGNYFIEVLSLDSNYTVLAPKTADGTGTAIFVVSKAKVKSVLKPVATSVTVGESLGKSTLSSGADYGRVYYDGFAAAIPGKFTYVQSNLAFTVAGNYEVEYLFTPTDSNNFSTYRGTVIVTVRMASAEIKASGTEFTYGEKFSFPTFTTNPSGLKVVHDIGFEEFDSTVSGYVFSPSHLIPVGTYAFHAHIESENYTSESVTFYITIRKKTIALDFITVSGGVENVVSNYVTTYGVALEAKIKLYVAGSVQGKAGYYLPDEVQDGRRIEDVYQISYVSTDPSRSYNSHIRPTERGTYQVTVSLLSDYYYAVGVIGYHIERGVIDEVYFDTSSLQKVYGQESAPRITTSPNGVSYYIIYPDGTKNVPVNAGNYNIRIYFDDDNYEKKEVSAVFTVHKKAATVQNLIVEDKLYNGTATLNISATLGNILQGDEISISLTARTLYGAVNVGAHYVEILSCTLSGNAASNYYIETPTYSRQVIIYMNKVTAKNADAYMASAGGFIAGTTLEVSKVNVASNKSNFITKSMGITAIVMYFNIQENGVESMLSEAVTVYIKIPDGYSGNLGDDFTVKGTGNLAGQSIGFEQHGDYIVFNVKSSGGIVFEKVDFQYGPAVVIVSLLMIGIGALVMVILNPMSRRKNRQKSQEEKQAISQIKRGY